MTDAKQVDEEDLDYDYDENLTLYKGAPFTGQAVERNSKGNIVELATYKKGIEHGLQKSWHPEGDIKSEGFTNSGIACGVWKSWFPNGQISEETEFDASGNRIYLRQWNIRGEITRDEYFHERLAPPITPEEQ